MGKSYSRFSYIQIDLANFITYDYYTPVANNTGD